MKGGASFHCKRFHLAQCLRVTVLLLLLWGAAIPSHARDKDVLAYGEGLIVNIPLPEPEVALAVEDVAESTIIRGTKEYDKDPYVTGAAAVNSTPVFPEWTEGGKVFYKVKKHALDPRNFKDSGDLGTLAVRYIVQPQGFGNTVLRIDALFVEDSRHSVHQSSGVVESAEYQDIQEHLNQIELMKKETAEALRAKQEKQARDNFGLGTDNTILLSTPPSSSSDSTSSQSGSDYALQSSALQSSAASAPEEDQQPETLEQHVAKLRQQVERRVKKPGAPLQSAPFHSASTLTSLDPGVEVLILISTPYWYGVETHEGQHGWIRKDELEQVP